MFSSLRVADYRRLYFGNMGFRGLGILTSSMGGALIGSLPPGAPSIGCTVGRSSSNDPVIGRPQCP
jgi:hypothetical protein